MRKTGSLTEGSEQSALDGVLGGTVSQYSDKEIIYSRGKKADSLFYIREGDVMLSNRSNGRRPAVISILGAGDFFGQSCLGGVSLRIHTASAIG
jgi:CRP/FNR family cyclic AMP-dependent transcriptional regulator